METKTPLDKKKDVLYELGYKHVECRGELHLFGKDDLCYADAKYSKQSGSYTILITCLSMLEIEPYPESKWVSFIVDVIESNLLKNVVKDRRCDSFIEFVTVLVNFEEEYGV